MVTFQKKNSQQIKFGLRKIYELIRLSKSSEIAHTVPALVIFPLIIQSLIQGKITMGLFLIIFFIARIIMTINTYIIIWDIWDFLVRNHSIYIEPEKSLK